MEGYARLNHACSAQPHNLCVQKSRVNTLVIVISDSNSMINILYVQITTTSLRIKEVSDSKEEVNGTLEGESASTEGRNILILYEFPLFRISYCGTSQTFQQAFSFVAKDTDEKLD